MTTSRISSRPPVTSPLAGRDRRRVLQLVSAVKTAFDAGRLGPVVHEVHPDVPESSSVRRLYFTLAPALNYQRRSEGLWAAALRTFEDPETRFVFDPGTVNARRGDFPTALTKHGLAVQPVKQVDIWLRLLDSLKTKYGSDPLNLFQAEDFDVARIKARVRSERAQFPYLSGPKLLNYWLYMIVLFTDVPLMNRERISIIPDTHVRRASVRLGLCTERETSDPELVATSWEDLLRGTGLTPMELHAPLWRWGRLGFPSLLAE